LPMCFSSFLPSSLSLPFRVYRFVIHSLTVFQSFLSAAVWLAVFFCNFVFYSQLYLSTRMLVHVFRSRLTRLVT
jgi:hypothetical protein